MKNKVSLKAPRSLEELKIAIMDVWINEITPEFCRKLAFSMPSRRAAIMKSKGACTKY